jgi:hypothetical protein
VYQRLRYHRRVWTLLLLVARAEDRDDDGFAAAPDGPDCDDDDPEVHPGARETCAVGDEDCDGFAQRAPPGAPAWRRDADGDGFGDELGPELVTCEPPAGWVSGGGDCADHDARRFPGADEVCGDGLDDDCDGEAPACAPPPLTADPGCRCAGVGGQGGWSAALLGALAAVGGRRRSP